MDTKRWGELEFFERKMKRMKEIDGGFVGGRIMAKNEEEERR